jgi:ech hydrogenase subunit F
MKQVMLITVLKNLFSKPATRRYPFKDVREPVPGYRGKILFDRNVCISCEACARICPAKAIEISKPNRQIKYYPFNCIYCHSCVEVCPVKCITEDAHYTSPSAVKGVDIYEVTTPPKAAPAESSKPV